MTTRHVWLLRVSDPNGEELSLWSTKANAERAKRQCMELWMRADCAAMEMSRETEATRPQFTDALEDYLYDCKITFFIMQMEVDDERYNRDLGDVPAAPDNDDFNTPRPRRRRR